MNKIGIVMDFTTSPKLSVLQPRFRDFRHILIVIVVVIVIVTASPSVAPLAVVDTPLTTSIH